MKEHKFKVGDRVCIIDAKDVHYGKIGIVIEVTAAEPMYRIECNDGKTCWQYEIDLEMVPTAKHSPGDRFVIEVESVLTGEDRKPLYKIKGFNALVFDDGGLDRLERAEDKDVIDIREHYNVIRAELADAEKRASLAADDIRDVKRVLDYIKDGKKA